MYQIKWKEIIPQILPKIIDRRVVRAHGSYFDCQFTLDFDDNSCIQFKCDDVIHRNAIEFEIILNRQKIYNPLHFDSTDVFTNNLGVIIDAKEYHTTKRNNVREIYILFDAKKKFFKVSQLIFQSTKFNQYKLNESVSDEITTFLQPRNDKMTIRTYRKQWHDLQKYEHPNIQKIVKHKQLIKKLYHEEQSNDNEEDINYQDSVFNLYPIQSNQLTLQQLRNGINNNHNHNNNNNNNNNNNDIDQESQNVIVRSLYPIKQTDNDDINMQNNGNNGDDGDNDMNMTDTSCSDINSANSSSLNLTKKDYDKVYCDVICRISSWNTFTATAKKKKY